MAHLKNQAMYIWLTLFKADFHKNKLSFIFDEAIQWNVQLYDLTGYKLPY